MEAHGSPVGMIGRWDGWLAGPSEPFGDETSYLTAALWLEDCESVEDWGCGKAWARRYFPQGYRGIDGSGPHADKIADLRLYHSHVDGILIRHVLEHNYHWRSILASAVESFEKRMALILFTPMAEGDTHQLAFWGDPGVPDLSFAPADIESRLKGLTFSRHTIKSGTQYGEETIYLIER